jgi:hypothetical protein
MADDPDSGPSRTSFAFERRAALPDHGSDAWRDAGKARAAFDPPDVAQAPALSRARVNDNGATGGAEAQERPSGFVLPDPRPSFARPSRLRGKEEFQAGTGAAGPGQMDKQTFLEVRREASEATRSLDKRRSRDR